MRAGSKLASQYGRNLDNKAYGGKVVPGTSGPIHIEGNLPNRNSYSPFSTGRSKPSIQDDIMKVHPKTGESILAIRDGGVKTNQQTGYNEYWKWGDKKISDPLQRFFGIGEYGKEEQAKSKLKGAMNKLMGPTISRIDEGTEMTKDFIGSQTESNLEALQENVLQMRTGLGNQMQNIGNIQIKTDLVSSPADATAVKTVDEYGQAFMRNIGNKTQDIRTKGNYQKWQADTKAKAAKQELISNYITTVGELPPEKYMSVLDDYNQTLEESVTMGDPVTPSVNNAQYGGDNSYNNFLPDWLKNYKDQG